jgi:15-cis-phytoene synthase
METTTIATARDIQKQHGTSYYLATTFLPRPLREAVFVLYAFVRIPDEIVDNPSPHTDPKKLLADWKNDWILAYDTKDSTHPILRATSRLFHHYHIPLSVSIEFIDAMIMDLTVARYRTYDDLRAYMRGSAQVVGVMLTYLFGYKNESAFVYAEALGEAMQLTNFLRDVHEDYESRGRIYLPEEDLKEYGVTEDMIRERAPTPEWITLMQHEIARARSLYRYADDGIPLLSKQAQRPVRIASRLYEAILDEIELQKYDVFTRRARVSGWRKFIIIMRTYVKH